MYEISSRLTCLLFLKKVVTAVKKEWGKKVNDTKYSDFHIRFRMEMENVLLRQQPHQRAENRMLEDLRYRSLSSHCFLGKVWIS